MKLETAAQAAIGDATVPGPELTVVVPTRNERENIAPLVDRLREVLAGIEWEAIFVDDDSTDGTIEEVRRVARRDRRVRLLHRIGRRGLASACIEGMQASTAQYVAVMDADLQHDEALLPQMLATLKAEAADLVVGSRYIAGGGIEGWDAKRANISDIATRLGRLVLRVQIADPMSGFFMMPRETFDRAVRSLSALGFKILVDLLASSPVPLKIKELPYQFRPRVAGESKLDTQVAWEYIMLLADKLVGHIIPVRFVLFSLVGVIGLAAHLLVLGLTLNLVGLPFAVSQAIATATAMVGNFTLNNLFTYSDRRLVGWGFVRGLVSFSLICGVGAVANVGIASFLFGTEDASWWFAGIAGAAMSSVWNYAVSSVVTWKRR
jgi:dolichol-phosphate mannosyltransferase